MFTGRIQELERLEGLYASGRSSMIVLYGRSGIGKTALVRRFVQGKNSVYYAARRATKREQLLCMKHEWQEAESAQDFYEALLALYRQHARGKRLVLVFF